MPKLPTIILRRYLRSQTAQIKSMTSLLLSAARNASKRPIDLAAPSSSPLIPEGEFRIVTILPVFCGRSLDLIDLTQMTLPKSSTALALIYWKKIGIVGAVQLYGATEDPSSWALGSIAIEGSIRTLYRSVLPTTTGQKTRQPWIFVVAHLRFQGLVVQSGASQVKRIRVIKAGNTALLSGSWHGVRSIALKLALEEHGHFRAIARVYAKAGTEDKSQVQSTVAALFVGNSNQSAETTDAIVQTRRRATS